MSKIADFVVPQLERLKLERNRPLLIVDADEVLVYFLRHFATIVPDYGWNLDLSAGTFDKCLIAQDGTHAQRGDSWAMLQRFFDDHVETQRAIPDAAETLAALSDHAQIMVLTNAPHSAYDGRRRNLDALGIPYPLMTNADGKGPVLRDIASRVDCPVVFVDDSAHQIDSAAQYAPDIRRLQLIGCDEWGHHLPHAASAEIVLRDWKTAHGWITKALAA